MHNAYKDRDMPDNLSADRWFKCHAPLQAPTARLYCFPFAGGGPSTFRDWQARFPKTEIWAVHLPGRESRMTEPPHTQMDSLMDVLAPLVAAHADRPFSLFGHSMGAMIAFELARRLEAAGAIRPSQLFLSGHGAPGKADESAKSHLLPHAEFVERIRKFDGTPEEVFEHKGLLDIFVPLLRADITLVETYAPVPDAQVDCPIVALGGKDDTDVPIESLAAWRTRTRTEFEMHVFDGGHFYWQPEPESMLSVIDAALPAPLTPTSQ